MREKSDDVSTTLRVVVAQMTSTDDVQANLKQMLSILNAVKEPALVDVFVFPENSLFMRLSKNAPMQAFTANDTELQNLIQFAAQHQTRMLVTLPWKEESQVSNATVLVDGDGVRCLYRKIHLFDVDVKGQPPVRESDNFASGKDTHVLRLRGWKIGLSICYDLRFAELFWRYARESVDLLLVPSAFLVPTGQAHWHVLLRARAIECQCFVAAPAQGGEHRSLSGELRHTYGHSLLVSPWGEIIGEIHDNDLLQWIDIKLERAALENVRRQIPMVGHRRL